MENSSPEDFERNPFQNIIIVFSVQHYCSAGIDSSKPGAGLQVSCWQIDVSARRRRDDNINNRESLGRCVPRARAPKVN